jgi:hypothetical protein
LTDDEQISLRKTTFGDGEAYPDDWRVFWRGLPVGRILKQPGVPYGRPNWRWGVNFDQRSQHADHKGICADIEECKRRFKVAWSGVRDGLTEQDIETARRHLAEGDSRLSRYVKRYLDRA